MELRFEFERETKNTYRFKERPDTEDGETMIDILYVRKKAFESRPEVLMVTIEVEE